MNNIITPKFELKEIWVYKDGTPSICPFNPGLLVPEGNNIQSLGNSPKLVVDKHICNITCPFIQKAEKHQDDEIIEGFLLTCSGKPIFLELKN
jgi:hypothetical protein